MNKNFLLAGMLISCACLKTFAQNTDTARADAIITNATVYFGYGAELTHESKVKVEAGTKVIVINMLGTTADINSLQISVPEDIALLSQRYAVYYPVVPPLTKNREADKLEDSIFLLQKEIGRINNLISIDQEILNKTGLLIESTINNSGNKTITSDEVL
ncbi:MAG: DUF4140 domain-containing protein, partial [Chitinophagaceae bacterium]